MKLPAPGVRPQDNRASTKNGIANLRSIGALLCNVTMIMLRSHRPRAPSVRRWSNRASTTRWRPVPTEGSTHRAARAAPYSWDLHGGRAAIAVGVGGLYAVITDWLLYLRLFDVSQRIMSMIVAICVASSASRFPMSVSAAVVWSLPVAMVSLATYGILKSPKNGKTDGRPECTGSPSRSLRHGRRAAKRGAPETEALRNIGDFPS